VVGKSCEGGGDRMNRLFRSEIVSNTTLRASPTEPSNS
jgi:hypothetical protein